MSRQPFHPIKKGRHSKRESSRAAVPTSTLVPRPCTNPADKAAATQTKPNFAYRSARPPSPQRGDGDDVTDARSGKSQSSDFHLESLRLDTTREVKGLLDDASNEGSNVQRCRHRPRSMQCFREEFTIPLSLKPVHEGEAA
jgi:hypothetical protein